MCTTSNIGRMHGDLKLASNHTTNPNFCEQACFLVHMCAYSQQVNSSFLTLISKGLASISNRSKLYYVTTLGSLFPMSLQGSQF
jgi:hypothetical protein